jgi:LysR family nitrogen assimilation transcriptional regulator
LEFRQIQYFICLYEEGTVTGAARRVNVVQPALSAQIAKLEEELGQKLFVRNARGMMPTDAARRMYQLYVPILRDLTHAREQMLVRAGEISGDIVLGMISSLGESILSDVLLDYARAYPKVKVTVANGPLLDWVADGKIDAAIIDRPKRPFDLNVDHIGDDDLVLVGPAGGHIAEGSISLAQVAALPLALTSRLHGVREIVEHYARLEHLTLRPVFEVDSMTAIVKLVDDAGVYAVLPRTAVRRRADTRSLVVRDITSPAMTRELVCVSHPRRPLNTATMLFIDKLREHIRDEKATAALRG